MSYPAHKFITCFLLILFTGFSSHNQAGTRGAFINLVTSMCRICVQLESQREEYKDREYLLGSDTVEMSEFYDWIKEELITITEIIRFSNENFQQLIPRNMESTAIINVASKLCESMTSSEIEATHGITNWFCTKEIDKQQNKRVFELFKSGKPYFKSLLPGHIALKLRGATTFVPMSMDFRPLQYWMPIQGNNRGWIPTMPIQQLQAIAAQQALMETIRRGDCFLPQNFMVQNCTMQNDNPTQVRLPYAGFLTHGSDQPSHESSLSDLSGVHAFDNTCRLEGNHQVENEAQETGSPRQNAIPK